MYTCTTRAATGQSRVVWGHPHCSVGADRPSEPGRFTRPPQSHSRLLCSSTPSNCTVRGLPGHRTSVLHLKYGNSSSGRIPRRGHSMTWSQHTANFKASVRSPDSTDKTATPPVHSRVCTTRHSQINQPDLLYKLTFLNANCCWLCKF